MSHQPEYSRLCRLIDDSLRPYTELVPVSLTKENEKHLLISLSQVLRQIQLWIHELDCDSENEKEIEPASRCPVFLNSHSEVHHCSTKIIGDLVVLLAIESLYVQHVAGSILVAISEFVVASGNNWGEFMHLLCLCLELGICSCLSSSFKPPTNEADDSDSFSSCFIIALMPRLKYSNWLSVASIIRVLRNIVKHLMQEYDDQFLQVYLNSISCCLSKMPWDLLNKNHVGWNGKACRGSCGDFLHNIKVEQLESRIMFYGNLVQFFCSLVEQSGLAEAGVGSLDKHPVICEIRNLVPNLLVWCLDNQEHPNKMCISHYLRHKMLMLMIKLSFRIPLESSVLVSWLHLIHKYFDDLLSQSILGQKFDLDDCLEGSPFWMSVSEVEKRSISSLHLQRLVIFLFLRCTFSLISMRERTDEQCVCENLNLLTFDLNLDLECCRRKKGLLELYLWLQGQLPADIFVDHKLYSERCVSFTLSFLRLYMHEDDILFDVLLQLFHVPFCSDPQICNGGAFRVVNGDMIFLVSDLFNPVYLFHLFLAELLYDHQVLLDYLISKDTGASCAEYLLRCLRVVCESWNLFVEFPESGKVINQSSCKKRKGVVDGVDIQGELPSAPVKGDEIYFSHDRACKRDHTHGSKHCRIESPPFQDAKECLLSLKRSVENLHKKNLFPYNPEVLLRRLKRFQELSLKH